MKTVFLICFITAAAFSAASSQTPVAVPANQSPLQQLQAIKEKNIKLLEQQTKTLQRLEELEKTSQSLKALGRRT